MKRSKSLITRGGIVFEEGSDIPFTGNSSDNKESVVTGYKDGKISFVKEYGAKGKLLKVRKFEAVYYSESDIQEFDFQSLRVRFYQSLETAYSEVSSGSKVLQKFSNASMEYLKKEVREFLKDPENIKRIIEKNHQEFLKEKEIADPENIKTFYGKKDRRITHCYRCQDDLDSFNNLSCEKCKWILCPCGACGCGFEKR